MAKEDIGEVVGNTEKAAVGVNSIGDGVLKKEIVTRSDEEIWGVKDESGDVVG